MTRGRRLALTTLATALAVLGLLAGYVKVELAEPEAFADRGVAALQSDAVRAVIAEQVAVQLLERRSPDLIATRPLVLVAVEAILETDGFERILRRSVITAHGVLVRGDSDVSVELSELREILVPALRSASPALARQIPTDLRTEIAEVRATDAATLTVRAAESAGLAALPLLIAALLGFAAAVATAGDRRRAAGSAGISLAVGMGVGVVALAALRAQVVSHTDAVGVISEDEARAAAGAAFDALASDLRRLLIVTGAAGLAVWTSALLAGARVDRRAALGRAVDVLAGGALSWPVRVARGLALAVVGGLVLLRTDPVFEVVVALLGGALLLLGLAEALSVARPGRPSAAKPSQPRRRRTVLAAGAFGVAAAGAAAALLLTAGPPAPLKEDEVVACNGLPELCSRRLDQVVLPGTHNSMSAADRPGWLFANQSRPIPRQLDDGIRLLLLDPHYGIVNREGRIRTDLGAEGTTRNRAAAELGSDAVRVAERLAGRLGLVPTEGERKLYLCHTLCELGAERFSSTLREVRGWLEANRSEVLVLFLESSVASEEIEDAFEDAELGRYLATLPRGRPLPTLRQLITSGRRLIVLDDGDGGDAPWYQPGFLFTQSTSIDAFTESQASCRPGRGTPESPLLLMNHWVDRFPPPARAARDANRRAVLLRRARACRERLGRLPNLVPVDFYERGDVVQTARELNRSGEVAEE
jgi:hypothetical protein